MALTQKENRRAYDEAVKALQKEKIDEVKALVKQALEELHKAEKARQEAVEKIQFIKHDLDDLRAGKLDKIKERHEKVKKADQISPITPQKLGLLGVLGMQYTHHISTTGTYPNWAVGSPTNAFGTLTNDSTKRPSVTWSLGQLQSAASGTFVLDDGTVKHM